MTGILNLLLGAGGVIKDTYFNLVSLLLPGNGTNGAQNNTFLDGSSNNFTITRNGNTTQGTFSPFSQTGWGNYFNGTNAYLSTPSITIGTGDFTVEGWQFILPNGANYGRVVGIGDFQTSSGLGINFNPSTSKFEINTGNSTIITSSGTFSYNTWYHISLVRSGTTVTLYVNGTSEGSVVNTNSISGVVYISAINYTSVIYYGASYTSNVRITTTAIVPPAGGPTAPLTAVTGTLLLTCQSNRFIDTNTQVAAKTITVNGSPSVTPFSPFAPTAAYSAEAVGGSGYFDGTGDYLEIANNAAFDMSTGNFTAEFYVYTQDQTNSYPGILANSTYNATGAVNIRYDNTGNANKFFVYLFGASPADPAITSGTYGFNQWMHVALVRDSSTSLKLYINGVLDGSQTISSGQTVSFGSAASTFLRIGRGFDVDGANGYYAGNVSNVRIVKGQALASGNFTPPTAPVTTSAVGWSGANAAGSLTGTVSLLLNFTNAGVVDATAKNVLETVGNAQISTTQSKWGGGSIYFDGTGDWLTVPKAGNWSIGSSEPFTIEAWVYLTAAQANYRALLSDYNSGSPGSSKYLFINSSGIEFQLGTTAGTVASCTQSFSQNQWYYIAITRNSSNVISMYVDGVSKTVSQATQSGAFLDVGSIFYVGRWGGATAYEWYGYIDDLRITKGVARTITASPTAPFPVQ